MEIPYRRRTPVTSFRRKAPLCTVQARANQHEKNSSVTEDVALPTPQAKAPPNRAAAARSVRSPPFQHRFLRDSGRSGRGGTIRGRPGSDWTLIGQRFRHSRRRKLRAARRRGWGEEREHTVIVSGEASPRKETAEW